MKHFYSIIVILFVFSNVFAQHFETDANFDGRTNHFTLGTENDLIFQTDKYYTAGISLSFTNSKLKKTLAQLLLPSKNGSNYVQSGFGIEYKMFTPSSIINPLAVEMDRPYSAYMLLTNFSFFVNPHKNLAVSNQIGLGFIGPSAGGEQVQSFVHQLIGNQKPRGWSNQLGNAFLVDYQIRIEKGFLTPWLANHLIPLAMIHVGSLKDEMDVGVMLKFGNKNEHLKARALICPKPDQFIWEWVFEARVKTVFYDATLQGSLFSVEELKALPASDVSLQQIHLRTGINVYYQSIFLRIMLQSNSHDFTSGVAYQYGGITIGSSF